MLASKSAKLSDEFDEDLTGPTAKRVFVFESDGALIGAALVRNTWELIAVGDDPRLLAAGCQFEEKIREVLKRAGIDQLVAWIPKKLCRPDRKSGMRRLLERLGFYRLDDYESFETRIE